MKNIFFVIVLLFLLNSLVLAQDPAVNYIQAFPEKSMVKTGQEFDVLVRINTGKLSVYSASFILDYGDTYNLDVVSVSGGDFLGSDTLFAAIIKEANSDVHISISQKGEASGNVGIGTLAIVRFRANNAANMDIRTVNLYCFELDIRDPNTKVLNISNTSSQLTIAETFVWPGDADNNGMVNEADILQIGLHFNQTGNARPNASFDWKAQPMSFWNDTTAMYVDATGDGRIKINDMPAIGFNYGLTHFSIMPITSPLILLDKIAADNKLYAIANRVGNEVTVSVIAKAAQDLFGISFKIFYNPAELSFIDAYNGEYMPGGIFFKHVDTNQGLLASAVTLTRGEDGVTDTKSVMIARFNMLDNDLNLHFQDVVAYNTAGNRIEFEVTDLSEVLGVKDEIAPTEYSLAQNYPNPFNPTTTIRYTLPRASTVTLIIYNVLGQKVISLVNSHQNPGTYTVPVNASELSDGIYFYTLSAGAGTFTQTKTMMLVK